jgi:hypothetical protein
VSAVTQAGKKAGRSKSSTDIALDVLANPPKSAGVDSERCAPLMKRELIAYRARTIEIEAMLALKQLAFAMADAHARTERSARRRLRSRARSRASPRSPTHRRRRIGRLPAGSA